MKRALMYASVASMIQQFNMNNIKLLKELGYEVDVACNFEFGSTISNEKIEKLKEELLEMGVRYYHIPIPRRTTDFQNLRKSYRDTVQLMNENKYDIVHCHSPIGGLVCRYANKNSLHYRNVRMIYTAHGFHFFKGNNLIKNFIFRNIERVAAKYTDILITINKIDFMEANKFTLKKKGRVEYVPGVGVEIDRFAKEYDKRQLREKYCFNEDDYIILSIGELNKNKNHKVVLEAISKISNHKIKYIICGQGPLKTYLQNLSKKLKIDKEFYLMGYQTNVEEFCAFADVFAFPSKREGLGLAALEAMAAGLPIITSNRGGILDYSEDGKTGYLSDPNDVEGFKRNILLLSDKELRKKISSYNKKAAEQYDIRKINTLMEKIYKNDV